MQRYPANARLVGAENIDLTRKLLSDGWIVTAAGDHKSLADIYTIFSAALEYKFNDLPENARVVMGVKWTRKFPTSLVKRILDVVETVPSSIPKDKFPDRDAINQRAFDQSHNSPDGRFWIVTPEGTRTDGVMEEGKLGSKEFWHGADNSTEGRLILPVAVEGTENQWPKEEGFRYFLKKGRFNEAIFIFGKPVKVEDVDELAFDLAKGDEELFKVYQVQVVMVLIASQHLSSMYTEKFRELVKHIDKLPFFNP